MSDSHDIGDKMLKVTISTNKSYPNPNIVRVYQCVNLALTNKLYIVSVDEQAGRVHILHYTK